MLLDLILLSTAACFACGLVLTWAVRGSVRWGAGLLGFFWLLFGLPMGYVLGTLFSPIIGAGAAVLFESSGTGAMPLAWTTWQVSMLLATVLPVLTFLLLTLSRPTSRALSSLFALGFLTSVGFLFTLTSSLMLMLLAFEFLLLASLYLLRLTAKSDRVVEAAAEMFFWTLIGSAALLAGFTLILIGGGDVLLGTYAAQPVSTLAVLLLCLGFGVKLPVWPCFSWLLKAHVEASVEFSILLSGIVVKFGALGLQRVLSLQESGIGGFLLAGCCTIAMCEASLRLLAQRDLKRIVALTTVIEVNWIGLCLGLGGSQFSHVGAFVLVAHSLTTTAEFYMVECLYRRYQTRDIVGISGLALACPSLYVLVFLNVLTTIGFPGTSLFAGKLLFLTALAQYSLPLLALFSIILVLWLPLVFMRIWVPIWYGQMFWSHPTYDVSARELALLVLCIVGSLWLGLCPAVIL